ncbi:hypothetical protein LIER_11493 [Lithospermum erythrorhizon]|uniref:Uncharacterized protein n=1 Tax=Lithospermum erythrorhizon TaxID=34254 RepID=A0AAV3PQ54_LITER
MELNIATNKGDIPSVPAASYSKARYEPRKPKEASKLEKKETHDMTSKTIKFSFRTKKIEGGLDLVKKERLTLKRPRSHSLRLTILGHPIEKCFIFKERVIDLERKGAITLEEDKVSSNHITLTIVQPTKVKVPTDFWESKLIPGKAWSDYSDDKDYEASHISVEVDDNSTTVEALMVTIPASSSLQTFAITFTDGDLPQEDGTHNKPLYVSGYVNENRISRMLVDGGSAVNILPLQTLKLLGISIGDLFKVLTKAENERWENNAVSSIFHQCLKYCKDGMKRIVKADKNSFVIEESHFADAKYYKKKDKSHQEKGPKAPQVPPSPQEVTSTLQEVEKYLVQAFKGLTLLLTQPEKVVMTPLKGFMTPKEGPKIEHGTMGPKAYDLLLKASYDPAKDKATGQPPPEVKNSKIHGLNDTQNMMRKKGWSVKNSTTGLGYTPKPPLRLLINRPKNEPETKQELLTYTRPTGTVMWRGKGTTSRGRYKGTSRVEEDVKITVDELKVVNLGTDDELRPTYISALLKPEKEAEYVTLLKEFKDVFAWTYKEMSGLEPKVAVHHVVVK